MSTVIFFGYYLFFYDLKYNFACPIYELLMFLFDLSVVVSLFI